MIRWRSVALGAAVFVAAHIVIVFGWRDWFHPGGDYPPWFLNAGRAVAFTAGALFVTGLFVGVANRGAARPSIAAGGSLAAGTVAAMCVVLVLTGPGTLFPIALAIGSLVAIISCVAGALAGSMLGGARRRSRP